MSDATGAKRGADHLVNALTDMGVKTIFSLSGNQIMPVYDALIDSDIRLIHTRHEGAAVYMAEAHAQVTGGVGVALLTAGPGFANGLSAMYSARASETPMIVLTGDAPLGKSGQGAFQEMDQHGAAAAMAKASFIARSPAGLGEDMSRAARIAGAGRPGPVHVALPDDVLRMACGPDARQSSLPIPTTRPPATSDEIAAISGAIAAAARPLIVTGPTFCHPSHKSRASDIAQASGLPVVTLESPRGLRAPRLGAFAEILSEADLIVLVGKSPDFMLGFAAAPAVDTNCRFIIVDADDAAREQAVANLGDRVTISASLDAIALLDALATPETAASLRQTGDASWTYRVTEAIGYRPPEWGELPADSAPFHAASVGGEIAKFVAANPASSLVIDGGEIGQWAQAIVDADVSLINGPSGAIGGGLPYAIAAKAARPDQPALAVMGDGTAGFYFMEFETAVRENLPIVVIVGNDARWNAEHQIQLRDYGPNRTMGCTLSDTHYEDVARALGGHGEHVTEIGDLVPAIERAIASGKPACINVPIQSIPAPTIRRT